MNFELAKKTAIKAVKGSGNILMASFYKEKSMPFKGKGDIVTETLLMLVTEI